MELSAGCDPGGRDPDVIPQTVCAPPPPPPQPTTTTGDGDGVCTPSIRHRRLTVYVTAEPSPSPVIRHHRTRARRYVLTVTAGRAPAHGDGHYLRRTFRERTMTVGVEAPYPTARQPIRYVDLRTRKAETGESGHTENGPLSGPPPPDSPPSRRTAHAVASLAWGKCPYPEFTGNLSPYSFTAPWRH